MTKWKCRVLSERLLPSARAVHQAYTGFRSISSNGTSGKRFMTTRGNMPMPLRWAKPCSL
jgi:hypothetical protein